MYLTLAQRYRIVFLYSDNEGPKWVFKKIAKAMSCDSKTVKFWVQRYKDNEDLSDNFTGGPKRKITECDETKIIRLATNQKLSTRAIAENIKCGGLSVSNVTIYNYLKSAKLKYQKPLQKRLLSEDHKSKRLTWALEHREFNWNNCIFTDETTFYLNKSKSCCWSYKNQKKIQLKKSHPLKVNVWSCFSINGFGIIYFFKEILDSNLMLHIYKEGLIPSINMIFGNTRHECIVVEDNDPKHKSKMCQGFKSENLINVLPWPANSPGLNPI